MSKLILTFNKPLTIYFSFCQKQYSKTLLEVHQWRAT